MIRKYLYKFMQGRYGNDKLNITLAIVLLVIWFITFLSDLYILVALQLVIFALFIFRFLSRNTSKRYKENAKFLQLCAPVIKFSKAKIRELKDKDNKYFKCPKCKASLRVPKHRGNITVTCPVCKNKFDKKT